MSYKDILKANGYATAAGQEPDNTEGGGAAGAGDNSNEDATNEGGATGAATNDNPDGGAGDGGGSGADDLDIDDTRLLAFLKRKKGLDINSLDDLKPVGTQAQETEEEKKKREQEKRNKIRVYGLNSGVVTSNDLDNFARESARPYRDNAFEAWKQENYGGADPKDLPTEQELADEFNDEFLQFAEENDPKRARKEAQLQKLSNSYLKDKYGKVYELDRMYEESESDQQTRSQYTGNLQQAFSELGDTLTFKVKSGKDEVPYSFKLTPEVIDQARKGLESDDSFKVFGRAKLGKEALSNAIRANLINNHLESIISYVAETHANNLLQANARGRRGIPTTEVGTGSNQNQSASTATENPAMRRHLDAQKKRQVGK